MSNPARTLTLAIALFVALAPATTRADPDTVTAKDKTIVLAHAELDAALRDADQRVFTGTASYGPWIMIEKLEGGVPAFQYWVRGLRWGKSLVSIAREIRAINLIAFKRGVATFNALYEGRDWLSCSLDTRAKAWHAVCDGKLTGRREGRGDGKRRERVPSMAEVEAVTVQCNQSFSENGDKATCLDSLVVALKGPFHASAAKVPGACSQVFAERRDKAQCVTYASAVSREPIEVIAYCHKNGADRFARLACVAEWMKK